MRDEESFQVSKFTRRILAVSLLAKEKCLILADFKKHKKHKTDQKL